MSRTLRLVSAAIVAAVVLAGCGGGANTPTSKAAEPKTSPIIYPLMSEVNPSKLEFPDNVPSIVPVSGYVPPWTQAGKKPEPLFRCRAPYVAVKLTAFGAVEYKGSQVGVAKYSVKDQFGSSRPRDYWVSSTDEMPSGLLVYSTGDDDNGVKQNFLQPIDLMKKVTEGMRIAHIRAAALGGDEEKPRKITGITACFEPPPVSENR